MLMKLAILVIGLAVWFGIILACSKMDPPGLGTWEDSFVDPNKSDDTDEHSFIV